jgi:hypothetical protein
MFPAGLNSAAKHGKSGIPFHDSHPSMNCRSRHERRLQAQLRQLPFLSRSTGY